MLVSPFSSDSATGALASIRLKSRISVWISDGDFQGQATLREILWILVDRRVPGGGTIIVTNGRQSII